jgi:hypothetical protein
MQWRILWRDANGAGFEGIATRPENRILSSRARALPQKKWDLLENITT